MTYRPLGTTEKVGIASHGISYSSYTSIVQYNTPPPPKKIKIIEDPLYCQGHGLCLDEQYRIVDDCYPLGS